MNKFQIFLIILVSILAFGFVYSPHFSYPFPFHVDEWHHLTEAVKLKNGEYTGGSIGYRIGFQLFLLVLSVPLNLVSIYQFLPALWAVLSALTLFYLVYKKTRNFDIAIFAMLFFTTIKSNVNLTGLWFFTPLSFSLPFIFLYFYFFTEGLEKKKKKYITISLVIILLLIFVHSISFLFAIPILVIYSFFYTEYIKKNCKFFSMFLLVPIIGALFYKLMTNVSFSSLFSSLFNAIQFKYGWGILELNNSFLELYSLAGYIFAIIGAGFMLFLILKKEQKKYIVYLIWPIFLLIEIFFYRITGVSYLSPYQRNLYYFAISMPMLSAFGLYLLLKIIRILVSRTSMRRATKFYLKPIISLIIIILVAFFAFKSYFYIPDQIGLYRLADEKDIEAIKFLNSLPKSTIIAPPDAASTIYPLSGHNPIATIAFYGDRKDVESFFSTDDCRAKGDIIKKYNAAYVLSKEKINCGWKLIYKEGNFIYKIE
jgi:hypothetical protein